MVVGVLFRFKLRLSYFGWLMGLVVVSFTLLILKSDDKLVKNNCVVESNVIIRVYIFKTKTRISIIVN